MRGREREGRWRETRAVKEEWTGHNTGDKGKRRLKTTPKFQAKTLPGCKSIRSEMPLADKPTKQRTPPRWKWPLAEENAGTEEVG